MLIIKEVQNVILYVDILAFEKCYDFLQFIKCIVLRLNLQTNKFAKRKGAIRIIGQSHLANSTLIIKVTLLFLYWEFCRLMFLLRQR
jgi:hypothetical protein